MGVSPRLGGTYRIYLTDDKPAVFSAVHFEQVSSFQHRLHCVGPADHEEVDEISFLEVHDGIAGGADIVGVHVADDVTAGHVLQQ